MTRLKPIPKFRKTVFLFSALSFFLMLTSCVHVQTTSETSNHNAKHDLREYSVQSVLWQQNAAEYRALCYQAFNIAEMRLNQLLEGRNPTEEKLVIVTDIDETVLNNSPFNAKLIEIDEEYTKEEWANWVNRKSAKAIPGAKKFLDYAKSKGVEIFYITNRLDKAEAVTLANMKKVGFPFADKEHLLLKTTTSAKQARRNRVKKDHEIIMLLGDNLSDFSPVFDDKSTEKRNQLTDSLKTHFGKNFIVFPNPMYGDWETKGIYQSRYDWTGAQKDSIRKADLKAY